jgi:hypothetical protein
MLGVAGKNLAVIQKRLGRSSIQTTYDRYAHLLPGDDKSVADALGGPLLRRRVQRDRTAPGGRGVVVNGTPPRAARRAVVLFIGFVIALSYRPGHPWAGIVGGVVAIIVLTMFLEIGRTLAKLAEMKRDRP